ncbi:hypothetical protein C8R45DRAFT_923284 [Mycena sanguinolenta]|nr:hypothetical protein C8R45DRAFT_923284 [Mycena sanguinolenta]
MFSFQSISSVQSCFALSHFLLGLVSWYLASNYRCIGAGGKRRIMGRFPENLNVPIESAEERAKRRQETGTYKRLIFCDGTGQQTDAPVACPEKTTWTWLPGYTAPAVSEKDAQATDHKEWVPASNVTRLCRIVADADYKDGKEIEQMTFYQNGVATGALTALGETWSGAFGVGLNENVCEAYVWLCLNWIPGDASAGQAPRGSIQAPRPLLSGMLPHLSLPYSQIILQFQTTNPHIEPPTGHITLLQRSGCPHYRCINQLILRPTEIFIFGFSRGAFTARALSGLVQNLGMIDRSNLGEFHSIYDAYSRRAEGPNHEQTWKREKERLQNGLGCSNLDIVRIKVVGVWDTVKSLGFPENERVRLITAALGWDRKHAFHDAFTCNNVENAFHALALDEKRAAFSPTLWYLPSPTTDGMATRKADGVKTNLLQCWFPGAHSDVGGSYVDTQPFDSSDLSLTWMIHQCRPFLAFNNKRLEKELEPYKALPWWGAQPLHDSYTIQFRLNGQEIRRPGQYFEMQDVAKPLNAVGPQKEVVHASVRLRLLRARLMGKHKMGGVRIVEMDTMGLKVKRDKEGNASMVPSDEYDCTAMAGFRLELRNPAEPKEGYKWVKKMDDGKGVELWEDQLGEDECKLLDDDVRKLLDDPAKNVGLQFPAVHAAEPGSKTPGMFDKIRGYLPF